MKLSSIIPAKLRKAISSKAKEIAFRGDNVYCPCCEQGYITFLPYGLPKRVNSLCPGCQSVERQRLIWLFLKNKRALFEKQLSLLHFAPEKSFFTVFSKLENIDYYPVDLHPENYPEGTRQMDIMNIDFPDNFFDVIICSFVFEYVSDDFVAMKEIKRVLKKEGWALLHVFINNNLEKTTGFMTVDDKDKKIIGNFSQIRRYGKDFKTRLEVSGLNVEIIKNKYSPDERLKFGLLDEDIYLCQK